MDLGDLYSPERHEPLTERPWHPVWALQALQRIVQAAEDEFEPAQGSWATHPQDDPESPGERRLNLYWGAGGVFWALRELRAHAALAPGPRRDYGPWIDSGPGRIVPLMAAEQHGTASCLFGTSGLLLLQWMHGRHPAVAQRLYEVVQGNVHNPVNEPLWGNAGSVLAAIHMARATGEVRWMFLVQQAVQALAQDMHFDDELKVWLWRQNLYGRVRHHLGAGHGLAGNAYVALAGAENLDAATLELFSQRALQALTRTALRARVVGGEAWNWHPVTDAEPVARARAAGYKPLVQDCHGAPGVVVRLAAAPRTTAWDTLLRAAGEMTWLAGPLAKGPSLCHGSAGNAMACLKLWRRFQEPLWLERARRLAVHAAEQVEAARHKHGHGRHSLWTGDLGVALALHACGAGGVPPDDRFPTLDWF